MRIRFAIGAVLALLVIAAAPSEPAGTGTEAAAPAETTAPSEPAETPSEPAPPPTEPAATPSEPAPVASEPDVEYGDGCLYVVNRLAYPVTVRAIAPEGWGQGVSPQFGTAAPGETTCTSLTGPLTYRLTVARADAPDTVVASVSFEIQVGMATIVEAVADGDTVRLVVSMQAWDATLPAGGAPCAPGTPGASRAPIRTPGRVETGGGGTASSPLPLWAGLAAALLAAGVTGAFAVRRAAR